MTNPDPKPNLAALSISRLFGVDDVRVEFDPGNVTLLHATNGAGKSTVLRVIQKLLADDMSSIAVEPLEATRLEFSNGARTQFDRTSMAWTEMDADGTMRTAQMERPERALENPQFQHWVEVYTPYSVVEGVIVLNGVQADRSVLHKLVGVFSEQISTGSNALRLARSNRNRRPPLEVRVPAAATEASEQNSRGLTRSCRLIKSDRLHVPATHFAARRMGFESPEPGEPRVQSIAKLLVGIIQQTRESSRLRSSEIDGSFFARAISALQSGQSSNLLEEDERSRLRQELTKLHERLRKCALATSTLALPEAPAQSKSVLSILDVYLKDLLDKARATDSMLAKLELFAEILNTHLIGKQVELSLEAGIEIVRTRDGAKVPLDRLSSGEQHLIVLFFDLLFETIQGGVCLIDEPEISLNVDWQRRFINTVLRVAEVSPQQFVIATHSPMIAGDHTNLLRELEPADFET